MSQISTRQGIFLDAGPGVGGVSNSDQPFVRGWASMWNGIEKELLKAVIDPL
jgi:hypothetical protein